MNEVARPDVDGSRRSSTTYRVALVHSFYSSRQPSGENVAVLDQAEALRSAGHEVTLLALYTDALQGERGYALRAAVRVATGFGRSPLAALGRFGPDVVHVHNLFPNFGTRWLQDWPGAVVATLHNYRPACAGGTLFRDGRLCTECPDGDRWAGLRHACYRNSCGATLPLAWAGRGGARTHPVVRRAEQLVCPSEHSRDFYRRCGVPEEKLAVVPNSVGPGASNHPTESTVTSTGSSYRWVYVGRLSEEKGILPLLRGWPEEEPLDVIGSGPLEPVCRAAAPRSVRLLGALPRERLRARLPRYTGLVFPSTCPEVAPLVYQEALAAGVPVLALAGSAAADSVRRDGPGAVYSSNDELPQALSAARRAFPTLRDHCRRVHADRYTSRSWTAGIEVVYARAVQRAADRQRVLGKRTFEEFTVREPAC